MSLLNEQVENKVLLAFEMNDATHRFGEEPFLVTHELSMHPLFTLDAIGELADALPSEYVEHHLGNVPAVVGEMNIPRAKLTPGEVVRGIETNGCWMVLGGIQSIPGYRELVQHIGEGLASLVPGGVDAMLNWHCAIFLSAPRSTTPAHIDSEQGFLLQLRGTKQITFGRFSDDVTRGIELEHHHSGGRRHIRVPPVDLLPFTLTPCEGIHVPSLVPHWVENGESVSVSFSFGFRTPESLRRQRVYAFNARLRRLGVTPRQPEANLTVDRIKATTMQFLSRCRSIRQH